jgi:hypothetical protein
MAKLDNYCKMTEIIFNNEERLTCDRNVQTSTKVHQAWSSCETEFLRSANPKKTDMMFRLAKRAGEQASPKGKRINSDNWLAKLDEKNPENPKIRRASSFALIGETVAKPNQGLQGSGGKRGVRTLPFSRSVFEVIAKSFHIHGSIARAISRADVPLFSHAEIRMKDPTGRSHPAFGTLSSTSQKYGSSH